MKARPFDPRVVLFDGLSGNCENPPLCCLGALLNRGMRRRRVNMGGDPPILVAPPQLPVRDELLDVTIKADGQWKSLIAMVLVHPHDVSSLKCVLRPYQGKIPSPGKHLRILPNGLPVPVMWRSFAFV